MKAKTNFVAVCILMCSFALLSANLYAQSEDEKAIQKTIMNYIEGWYSADTVRMAKALDPSLVKRGLIPNPQTGAMQVAEATYSNMMAWTGRKPNEYKTRNEIPLKVVILEIGKNVATAKSISPDFIDYIHLARKEGEWKILNVIWEPAK